MNKSSAQERSRKEKQTGFVGVLGTTIGIDDGGLLGRGGRTVCDPEASVDGLIC